MSYSRAMMRMMLGLALVALVGGCDEKKDAPATPAAVAVPAPVPAPAPGPPGAHSAVDPALRVAVLVPAHDEARGIAATLATIAPQLRAGDRVVVVADNCTDDTAEMARAAGADVFERADSVHVGKSFAIA